MLNKKRSIIPDKILDDLIKDPEIGPELTAQLVKSKKISRNLRKASKKVVDINPSVTERFTYDNKNKDQSYLPGDLVREEQTPPVSDEIVNIAHENHAIVRQFIKEVLGRDSFDGVGADIHGTVHFEENYDNAMFTTVEGVGDMMIYGDGLLFKPLVLALDVAAHEIGHGITQHTSGLWYWSMPGQMNESGSDVYGVCCKQWNKGEEIPGANWLIGDDIVTDKFPGKAIRSFKDELAYRGDIQPKHMKNYNYGLSDNQMVHINSGILNHCFYQFCLNYYETGGRHSWEAPLQIWYKSYLQLNPWSNFWDLKKVSLKVCKKEYPKLVGALTAAWGAVGL